MIAIYFDGLCEPNPDGVATYAFVIDGITADPLDPITGCGVLDGAKGNTNNLAEWVALGKALAFLRATKAPVDELKIFGDSQLVINQLKGKWQCKNERLATLRDRCYEHLKALAIPREKVSAEWIPREQNIQADALSRAAYVGRVGKPVPIREKAAS